jgi:hypothetical protein
LERSWSFTPEQSWRAASYTLVTDANLEDLAGNTPAKPFEVDLDNAVSAQPPQLERTFSPVKRK